MPTYPADVGSLVDRVETMGPGEVRELAHQWQLAERSRVNSVRRAMARHLSLLPDVPGVIDILSAQLAISDAAVTWAVWPELGEEVLRAATAAALDMALVVSSPSMAASSASALAAPWRAAIT